MTTKRENILNALGAFMRQRSGIEFANYGDVKAFRAEQRGIAKDLNEARQLLAYVTPRESITEAMLIEAFRAFSGRLSIKFGSMQPKPTGKGSQFVPGPGNGVQLDYCTGQYFPTEYRKAVCAVLASAIWDSLRENMPAPDAAPEGADRTYNGMSAGDCLRKAARRELGAGIAKRWFN